MKKLYLLLVVSLLVFATFPVLAQEDPTYKKVVYHIDKLHVDYNYEGTNYTAEAAALEYTVELVNQLEGGDLFLITGNMTEHFLYVVVFLKVPKNVEVDITKMTTENFTFEGPTKFTIPVYSVIPLYMTPEMFFMYDAKSIKAYQNLFLTYYKVFTKEDGYEYYYPVSGEIEVDNTDLFMNPQMWINPALKDEIKNHWELYGGTATEENGKLKLVYDQTSQGYYVELVFDLANGFLESLKVNINVQYSEEGETETFSADVQISRTSLGDANKNVPAKNTAYAYKATAATLIEGLGESEPLLEDKLATKVVYNVLRADTGLDVLYNVTIYNETSDDVLEIFPLMGHSFTVGSVVVYPEWDIHAGVYQFGASLAFQLLSDTKFEYNETDFFTGEVYTFKGYYDADGTYSVLQMNNYEWVLFKTTVNFVYNQTVYSNGTYKYGGTVNLDGDMWYTYKGNGELMQEGYDFQVVYKFDMDGDGVYSDNETITGTLELVKTRVVVQDGEVLWSQSYDVPSVDASGWSEATPVVVYENEQRTRMMIMVGGIAVVAVAAIAIIVKLKK